jgi:hypothetical protein
MVTKAGPQSKVTTPPRATAATKASLVQLAGVPFPTTVVGLEVSSARASAGTSQWPAGLPAGGPVLGSVGRKPAPPQAQRALWKRRAASADPDLHRSIEHLGPRDAASNGQTNEH